MMRLLVILTACLGLTAACSRAEVNQPEAILRAYLESVAAGDWTEASSYWLAADVERSNRLGIRYSQIPFKLDCASPVIQPGAPDSLTLEWKATKDPEHVPGLVRPSRNPSEWTARYHLIKDADRWVLASAATAIGKEWPITRGRYLNVHLQPGMNFTEDQLAELDRFVAETCGRLGMSSAKLDKLTTMKLDYYLCDSAAVAEMAGAPTQGVALLPVDAVVTSDPFHQHELAHLLVNYALGDLPLYTLPFLQEGTAVHLGGRWGRSPAVMEELGRYVLSSGFVEVGEILSWQGFHAQLPDLTYAPSGILAGFLLDALGPESFLNLYSNLSGSFPEVARKSSNSVRAVIEAKLDLPAGGLEVALTGYASRLSGGGIEPGLTGGLEPLITIHDSAGTAAVFQSEKWVAFEIQVIEGVLDGMLDLVPKDEFRRANYSESRLYEERCPGIPYLGQRAAIIFNQGEVGLYDFALDQLVAKYIHDFRPDPDFLSVEAGILRFHIRKADFPFPIDEYDWDLVFPTDLGNGR